MSEEQKKGKQAVGEARSREACQMAIEEYQRIGARIARIRKAKTPKLTQNALAVAAGFSFDYISRIEQGKARPTMEALAEIALQLEVSLTDVLSDPSQGKWDVPPQSLHLQLKNQNGQLTEQRFKLVRED